MPSERSIQMIDFLFGNDQEISNLLNDYKMKKEHIMETMGIEALELYENLFDNIMISLLNDMMADKKGFVNTKNRVYASFLMKYSKDLSYNDDKSKENFKKIIVHFLKGESMFNYLKDRLSKSILDDIDKMIDEMGLINPEYPDTVLREILALIFMYGEDDDIFDTVMMVLTKEGLSIEIKEMARKMKEKALKN